MADWRSLAEEFRHLRDRLLADLETLDGPERDAALDALGHIDRVRTAIANRDHKAVAELLRQGEAAARLLHPERAGLN